MLTIVALLSVWQGLSSYGPTPFSRTGKLEIKSVTLQSPKVPKFGIEELALDIGATYDNPFDPDDIAVDATVTSQSGASISIPGFIYRPYQRAMGPEAEVDTPAGDPAWKVRICPTEIGDYSVVVKVRDRSGAVTSSPFHFQAGASTDHGFVRVSDKDRHYFQFDDGAPFFPTGANVCWGPKGTYDYDTWISAYGSAGANYSRLWLSPYWSTFGLLQSGKAMEGKGVGFVDLANAWRLDYVLDLARKNGMYLMLTLDSYNILRSKDAYPQWDKTPENQDNGGPLRIPTDFWTDRRMERFYKKKLRYLVARYGADTHVFCWEFWNEVDLTDGFDPTTVGQWHRTMGQELAQIDPYKHLRTTSMSNSNGDRHLDLIPEIDYVETHHYGLDPANEVAFQESRKAEDGKPHVVGEIGADASGPRAEQDPAGVQVHDPMWAAVASGCAGTAMSWWWDTLIGPHNLYPLFTAVSKFCADIDWPSKSFRPVDLGFAFADTGHKPTREDLVISDGPVDWSDSPMNQPRSVTIDARGDVHGGPVAGILHGATNHPGWHNPITFNLYLDRPTRLDVQVGDVSPYGGAGLSIDLDGQRVATKSFPEIPNNPDHKNISQYAGLYGVDIPPGSHTVVVSNPGNDWVFVSYHFKDLRLITAPRLQGWAVLGNDKAVAWIRLRGRSWSRAVLGPPQAPTTPAKMSMMGLASGLWKAEVWDTWKGVVTKSENLEVGIDGKASVWLPSVKTDVAVKLSKIP